MKSPKRATGLKKKKRRRPSVVTTEKDTLALV